MLLKDKIIIEEIIVFFMEFMNYDDCYCYIVFSVFGCYVDFRYNYFY